MTHATTSEGGSDAGDPPSPAGTERTIPSSPNTGAAGASGPFDPFERLGMPPRFDLDVAEIDRAWIRLAAACHPDRAADPVAAAEASRRSAQLNEARATLRDPERRAACLLQRLGGPSATEEKSLPPAFLAEMMELRERVESAVAGDDENARIAIEREVAAERDGRMARVAALFAEENGDPARLREIRLELNVWRYHERLLAELRGTAAT